MASKKKTPREKEEDSILSKKEISKIYDKVAKKLDAWEKKTFKGSGALGEIPGWFPQNDVIRLSVVREWLTRRWDVKKKKFVRRYSLKEIRKMMSEFREHTKTHAPASFNLAYGLISVVCHYDDAISAGPDEGLKMMVGLTVANHIQKHKRIKKASKEGIEVRFGTPEERNEEEQEYQDAIDKLHKTQPKWSHTTLCKEVATQFEVHYRTIYRRTDSPHAKK